MGWLLNRAGISIPDMTADGYYRKCGSKPDLSWGRYLGPMLAFAFDVSDGIAGHVGYVLQDLGSKKVILNANTQVFSKNFTWDMSKWWFNNVQAKAYGNVDSRFLSGDDLAAIVRGLKPMLMHQYDAALHGDYPTALNIPYYREFTDPVNTWAEVTLSEDIPCESGVLITGLEGSLLKLGIRPGTLKIYATNVDGHIGEKLLVAYDQDNGDGTGLIIDADDTGDSQTWSGTVAYSGENPLDKAEFSFSHTGASVDRDIRVEYDTFHDFVSPEYTITDAGLVQVDRAFNSYVNDRVRNLNVYHDFNSLKYASILLELIMGLTQYAEYDPWNTDLRDAYISFSRFHLWVNSLFNPDIDDPDKVLEDCALYLEGAYKARDKFLLTDRVQKLWLGQLGVTFEEGVGTEYRSDWEVRYLKRGLVDKAMIDFNNYSMALNELRNPSQSAMT
jgi:hypothetical protein